jgi:hypothetical protein
MSYEDLYMQEKMFTDDEITFSLNKKIIKGKQ